jgi:seryl-tRNA synthetase
MLDPKLLRESPELVRTAILKKHLSIDLDAVLNLDATWRSQLHEVENLRAVQKAANSEMAALKKGSPEFLSKVAEMKAVSVQVKDREAQLAATELAWKQGMLSLPNLPHASVPEGATPEQNVVFATHGSLEVLSPHAKSHWEIPGFDNAL